MTGEQKIELTNKKLGNKIKPDDIFDSIEVTAMEQRYGKLLIEFQVHDGQVRGAELISTRKRIMPL